MSMSNDNTEAKTEPEEMTRVNFNVPLSVRKRWKMAAAEQDRSLSDLVTEAVNAYLDAKQVAHS